MIKSRTVVANGFGQRADRDVFLIGPTGLALGADSTLYVSDALGNRIVAIPDAMTRTTSAGTGREVTKGGLLQRPLALIMLPNGHLLACNARNGQVVELDPDQRQADLRAVDRYQPGAVAARQRRPVRHRPEAGRQGLLLCRGRHEHRDGGPLTMTQDSAPRPSRRGLLAAAGGLAAAVGAGFDRPRRFARRPPRRSQAAPPSRSGACIRPAS